MLRIQFILIFSALTLLNCRAQEHSTTVVYESGYAGYSCFRIPAVVSSADGTLLAFAEARRDGTDDKGDIDLVLRRSVDGGKTWGELIVVWDDGQNTCGNPAPVVMEHDGGILLLATWNRGDDHEKEIEAGRGRDTRRAYLLRSDDNGLRWSTPEEITPAVKRADWTWYATGPCHAIVKRLNPHKGRIVVPANHKLVADDGAVVSYSHLIYSDDKGLSWQMGAVSQCGGNESTVTELSDGGLMLNMRHYDPNDSLRLCAVSQDGGTIWSRTWEEAQLLEPRCQGSILNYTTENGTPSSTLLFANPRSHARRNLSIGVSRDDGVTWSRFVSVCKGRAAYSDLVQLSDGSVGILYENGDKGGPEALYKRISFGIIPAASLFD